MRRTAIIALLALLCFMAQADEHVWNYRTNENGTFAGILSNVEYLDGDYDKQGTALGVFVGKVDGKDCVELQLFGDYSTHDLNGKRNTIVASFNGGKTQRWKVTFVEFNGFKYSRVRIVNSALFIRNLKKAEWFEITLPVYGQGATSFMFYCNKYPLEW